MNLLSDLLTGNSETLFPSILNSSIFVQFAKDAGTADSWLYLMSKTIYLLFCHLFAVIFIFIYLFIFCFTCTLHIVMSCGIKPTHNIHVSVAQEFVQKFLWLFRAVLLKLNG